MNDIQTIRRVAEKLFLRERTETTTYWQGWEGGRRQAANLIMQLIDGHLDEEDFDDE